MTVFLAAGYAGVIYTFSFDGKRLDLISRDDNFADYAGIGWLDTAASGDLLIILDRFNDAKGPVHSALLGSRLFVANYVGACLDEYDLGHTLPYVRGGSGVILYDATSHAARTCKKVASCAFRRENPANPPRQLQSHAHAVYVDPTGCFLLCVDLGADRIHVLNLTGSSPQHENGSASIVAAPEGVSGAVPDYSMASEPSPVLELQHSVPLPPGSGPRHLVFRDDTHCYVICELSNTIDVFSVVYEGSSLLLHSLQRVEMMPAEDLAPWTAAEIDIVENTLIVSSRRDSEADNHVDLSTKDMPHAGDLLQTYSIDARGYISLKNSFTTQYKGLRHFLPVQIDSIWYIIAAYQRSHCIEALELDSLAVIDHIPNTFGLSVVVCK